MAFPRHLDSGAIATGTASYSGQHREHEMERGWGAFPMGDRSRDIQEFGFSYLEERDSVDVSTSRKR